MAYPTPDGQQPFGGARGTNDKAGSMWNLIRWLSPRVVKETFVPPRVSAYPHQGDVYARAVDDPYYFHR